MAVKDAVKLYTDEDVRPLLAEVLRQRGYDAISAIEEGLIGLSDEEQILRATKQGRALLTHNIKDFVKLHPKFSTQHYGIILSDQIAFKILLRRVLKFLSVAKQNQVKGNLIWLGSFD
ncbi:MAG: DUF5615 family PIN-like protein [Candidatus Hydrothermarchaeota archaeon]|nr:DUF5615 family PIN-like protein [Candidatus Hydrothermarchaeota archaeon]